MYACIYVTKDARYYACIILYIIICIVNGMASSM